MKWRNSTHGDLLAALERMERLQHAQDSALQALAQRIDRLTAMLEADARHGLTARNPRNENAAIALARTGAGVDDLVRNCGLRAAEAELLLALYGRTTAHASVSQVA